VVGAARWWYWPRGDQRFVGRWLAVNAAGGGGIMVLRLNGTGRILSGGSWPSKEFNWLLEGDTFHIRQCGLGALDGVIGASLRQVSVLTGLHDLNVSFETEPAIYEVSEISRDAITLRAIGPLNSFGNRGRLGWIQTMRRTLRD